jgi:high-affinity iron transporter
MVFWMRRMEQGDSGGLRNEALGHVRAGNWLGLASLAALAVAREGAETVIFLYGMLSASEGWQTGIVVVSGAVGLVLAVGTFWAFRTGAAMASRKVLSRIGSGLAMTVIDKSISLGILTPLTAPLWDLSWLLDDGRGAGAFLAGLAGYRARPELLPLLGIGAYWLTASLAYMPPLREKAPA